MNKRQNCLFAGLVLLLVALLLGFQMWSVIPTIIWIAALNIWVVQLIKLERNALFIMLFFVGNAALYYFSYVLVFSFFATLLCVAGSIIIIFVKNVDRIYNIDEQSGEKRLLRLFYLMITILLIFTFYGVGSKESDDASGGVIAQKNQLVLQVVEKKLNEKERAYMRKTFVKNTVLLVEQSVGGKSCVRDLNSFECEAWIVLFTAWVKEQDRIYDFFRSQTQSSHIEDKLEQESFKEKYGI